MVNSRFYELFSALGHSDIESFDEFINSGFFNKNERVKKLWNYLKGHADGKEFPQKKHLEAAIFGNEKFSDSNFRMVISSFVKLAEEYLLQKKYSKNMMERKIRLLEIFENKGMRKSYLMYLKEIEDELDKDQERDSVFFYRKYFIECLKAKTSGGDIKAAREFAKKAFFALNSKSE